MARGYKPPPFVGGKLYKPITEIAAERLAMGDGSIGGVLFYEMLNGLRKAAPSWVGPEIVSVSIKRVDETIFTNAHWRVEMVPGAFFCNLPPELTYGEAEQQGYAMMDLHNLRRRE